MAHPPGGHAESKHSSFNTHMVLSSSNLLPNSPTQSALARIPGNYQGGQPLSGSRKRAQIQRVSFEESMEVIFPTGSGCFECNVVLNDVSKSQPSPTSSHNSNYSQRTDGQLHGRSANYADDPPRMRRHTYTHDSPTGVGQLSSSSNVVDLDTANITRRKSSPGRPSTNELPSVLHTYCQAQSPYRGCIVRARGHASPVPTEIWAHSAPNSVHPVAPSLLEPIPQGQELSVNSSSTIAFSGHDSIQNPRVGVPFLQATKRDSSGTQYHRTSAHNSTEIPDVLPSSPCCLCRVHDDITLATSDLAHIDIELQSMNHIVKQHHSSAEGDSYDFDKFVHSKSDHRNQSIHWARELLSRFRPNSIHTHPDHDRSPSSTTVNVNRRHSTPRSGESSRSSSKLNNNTHIPDHLNPKRLPKSNGPASVCLQFSEKPLHHHSKTPVITSSVPIPMTITHGGCGSSALKSSSWKPRKPSARVRWLSQSNSDEQAEVPSTSLSGGSSLHSRLCSSAVEEFRGAINILSAGVNHPAHGQPFPPSSSLGSRSGVRVKRASESQRLLVITKSLSGEDFSPLSVGHFDENHVYSTLFRYSTCYDVLPDSGKLVVLDSRIGIVRAIRALLENGVQAAPVWHSATQQVIGLLSQDLALHLLASLSVSLSCGIVTEELPSSPNSSEKTLKGLTEGLRVWGSRQLYEVIRLLASPTEGELHLSPVTLIAPQAGLKKALSRLLHPIRSIHPRLTRQTSIHDDDCEGPHQPMDTADSIGGIFTQENAMMVDDVPPVSHPTVYRSHRFSDPVAPKVSSRPPQNSNTTQHSLLPTVSPTHLIIMDPISGNLLGLLGVDRLLAYLRLRLDELPHGSQMTVSIGTIPGLFWADRHLRMKAAMTKIAHQGYSIDTSHNFTDKGIHIPHPILFPNTSCHDALLAVATWLSQLPALPVITPIQGAATQANFLQGFISPGDILHFVLGKSPSDAVSQPVSKILEAKMLHCRFQQEHACHTDETVAEVLDRMFRLRASCLVLMGPRQQDSHASLSAPVGMVTSRDLLRAILYTKSTYSPALMHSLTSDPSDSSLGFNSHCNSEVHSQVFDPASTEISFELLNNLDRSKLAQSTKSDSLLDTSQPSSAEESLSSGSTCSAARSPSDRIYSGSSMRRASMQMPSNVCSCACHHTSSRKFSMDSHLLTASTSSQASCNLSRYELPKTVEHQVASHTAFLSKSGSSSTGARRSVENEMARKSSPPLPVLTTSAAVHEPQFFPSKQITAAPERSKRIIDHRHRRGDDDESVFPMD